MKTDEPVCPDKQLQCGNGECIDKEKFCDEKADCSDGSDENACLVDSDPNRAPECDLVRCFLILSLLSHNKNVQLNIFRANVSFLIAFAHLTELVSQETLSQLKCLR